MKPKGPVSLILIAVSLGSASHLIAADRIRNATPNILINAAAWDDGTTAAPTASDRAVWNSTSVGDATTLGGDASWGGILISAGTPDSGPLFTNAMNPAPFTLTVGSSGINLNGTASTNRGISFESNTSIALGANQTWNLGDGQSAANISVAGLVSGTGSVEITRQPTALNYLQLSGANTFSGGLTVGTNAWLRLANGTAATTSGTAVTASPTGTSTLTLNEGALVSSDSNSTRVIANTQINLSGNVTFNQATGGTGRIQIAGPWNLGGSPRTITINKPSTSFGSGQEGLGIQTPAGFTAPKFENGALTVSTASGTSSNPAILRFTTTSFPSNGSLTAGDGVAFTSQNGAFFGTGANSPALTLATPDTRGGGVLQLGDTTATMRSAQLYSLAGGGTISASNTTGTPSQTGTITVNHGNDAVFSGTISQGGTGIIAFTKSGAGTQTLSGTNSYTGKTTISGGVLKFGKQVSLYNNTPASWTDANIQVDSGATLALNAGGTGEFTASDIQTLTAIGTAGSGFRGGSRVGIDTTNATGGSFTYGIVLANPNGGTNILGLRKFGTGTLVLTQPNTHTGGTIIDGGTLKITQPAALGTGGTVTINSGTTLDADFSALGAAGTISRTITGTGTIDATPADTFQLSFSSTILTGFNGTLNAKPSPSSNARIDVNGLIGSGSTINIAPGATVRLALSTGIYSGLTINVAGTGGSGPGALRLQDNTLDSSSSVNLTANASIGSFTVTSTIDAIISDGGSGYALTKAGDSILVLTGENTYTGNTNVNGGTLRISKPYLANTSSIAIAANAVLDLNFDETNGHVSDTVATLFIDGVQQPAGVYGATGSGATTINNTHFAGPGTVTVSSGPTPSNQFDTWVGGFGLTGGNAAFDFDFDNDGLDNGLEWILGGNPITNSASFAPAVSRDIAGNLLLNFIREEDSLGETTLTLEYGTTLGATFANSFVIDADGGTDPNGVTVSINQLANPDAVTVSIPPSLAPGGRVFARLKAVRN
jgi:autotransporter-associated beta strand protein